MFFEIFILKINNTPIKPMNIDYDLHIEKHDTEGRVICFELENYYLVTVYTPNSKRDLSR